jgi:hypothetical protein
MSKEQKEEKKKGLLGTANLFSMRKTLAQLSNPNVEYRISTKSLILDIFCNGGFRPGVTRFAAPEEHGKSALALAHADEFLTYFWNRGKKAKVIYYDAECRLFAPKIRASKIDQNKYFKDDGDDATFEHYQYNRYEEIATHMYETARANTDDDDWRILFILDSVDCLITQNGDEKGFDETEKVAAAQSISTVLMKKISPYITRHGLYITSQIRANLDMNNPNSPKTRGS